MVDVGLLTGANAAVDRGDNTPTQQLEDNHSRPRVHDLFGGGAVSFVADLLPARSWGVSLPAVIAVTGVRSERGVVETVLSCFPRVTLIMLAPNPNTNK